MSDIWKLCSLICLQSSRIGSLASQTSCSSATAWKTKEICAFVSILPTLPVCPIYQLQSFMSVSPPPISNSNYLELLCSFVLLKRLCVLFPLLTNVCLLTHTCISWQLHSQPEQLLLHQRQRPVLLQESQEPVSLSWFISSRHTNQ